MSEPLFDVISDGRTVWVNGPASCLGRFGLTGIDIHRAFTGVVQSDSECLYCTHGVTTKADWETFVTKMLELHGVPVLHEHMPDRLR